MYNKSMEYTFLMYQTGGDFLGITQRIKEEGHKVYLYKQKGMVKGRNDTGKGIFEKEELIDDAWEVINKTPKEELIIILDDNGEGDMADHLRKEGYMIIGGSAMTDKIEYERGLGTKLMGKIGLGLPEEFNFDNFADGIAFMEEQNEEIKFVFKPEGEDFAGSAKTYTAKNKQDMIDYLKWMENDCKVKHYEVKKFLFQEFIEGIEADFSGYFDGEKFMEGSCALDIEEKKSGDGNKGEATGCMGNILMYCKQCRYFDEYILKLAPLLKKIGYVGQISINNIFAYGNEKYEEGMPYGLEFTPRFGWDAQTTELAILKSKDLKISDFYIALATKQPFKFPPNVIGCGVRVYSGSISLEKKEVEGRYFSFKETVKDNVWLYSASYTEEGYSIEDNPVCVVNTTDVSLTKSIKKCYDILREDINIPDIYFRNEIGKRALEVILYLRKYNWI
jgi:phosphoribosylamine-glycine ligase